MARTGAPGVTINTSRINSATRGTINDSKNN